MSFVVVGKNSFIARHLKNVVGDDWVFLSHKQALESDDWCDDADVVINCAFSSTLYTQAYTQEVDIDLKLANKIKNRQNTHYLMISSRAVYGDAEDLQETNDLHPSNNYGQSKHLIENALTQLLGEDRLTILRCSNVFGEGAGEHTFIGKALSDLKEHKKIVFHMSKETKKDFVPVKEVCRVIKQMAQRKLAGVFNVGLGVSTKCGDIAEWLICGYGQGSLEVCDDTVKGQFFMNTSKVNKELNLNKRSDNLVEQECMKLGHNLK